MRRIEPSRDATRVFYCPAVAKLDLWPLNMACTIALPRRRSRSHGTICIGLVSASTPRHYELAIPEPEGYGLRGEERMQTHDTLSAGSRLDKIESKERVHSYRVTKGQSESQTQS